MSAEHIIQKLHRLRRLVDGAIDSVVRGEMRSLTPAEAKAHAKTFGTDAWVIGDFVITDRNAPSRSALADSSDFDDFTAPF